MESFDYIRRLWGDWAMAADYRPFVFQQLTTGLDCLRRRLLRHYYEPTPGLRLPITHRRRIYTEEKANAIADAWGTELLQFIAAQAILN